jgi:hypothetical protein
MYSRNQALKVPPFIRWQSHIFVFYAGLRAARQGLLTEFFA